MMMLFFGSGFTDSVLILDDDDGAGASGSGFRFGVFWKMLAIGFDGVAVEDGVEEVVDGRP